MKNDLVNNIKILALGYNEIILDIDLGSIVINSIELRNEDIILHSFINDIDFEINYHDIDEKIKERICNSVSSLLYN